MQQTFRQSMAWLHTWTGLILCWLMYFIFATGTLGYFDMEIDQWMSPELRPPATHDLTNEVNVAQSWLENNAKGAELWSIYLPNKRENLYLSVFAKMPSSEEGDKKGQRIEEQLDVGTGQALSTGRETAGGQTLYKMHYILHYFSRDTGYRIVGIITLIMFIGLITGIVIHKKIFKDLFTFRPNKNRRSWLDIHNLLSVATLPFQLMITYSGLIFVIFTWLPLIGIGSYGFDIGKVMSEFKQVNGEIHAEHSGEAASLIPLQTILNNAEEHIKLDDVRHIKIDHPGDTNAVVKITVNSESVNRFRENIIFDGVTGELLKHNKVSSSAPVSVSETFLGLHEGLFAGLSLRWLYFLSGLLGMGMIATGAIYWVIKRQKSSTEQQYFGLRLVSALNIGTIVGLPIAIAAYFLANRLLPIDMAARAEWEVHSMFIVWLIALLYPIIRPAKKAWLEQLWFAAFSFVAIPVINALTTERGLINSFKDNDWVYVGFDMTSLFFAVAFLISALFLQRRWSTSVEVPSAMTLQPSER